MTDRVSFRSPDALRPARGSEHETIYAAAGPAPGGRSAEGAPADIRGNQEIQDVYLGRARHHA